MQRRVQGKNPSGSFCFGGSMEYIEMEDDGLDSAVSDDTLYLVFVFCGPDVRDMLLYPVVENVRSINRAV